MLAMIECSSYRTRPRGALESSVFAIRLATAASRLFEGVSFVVLAKVDASIRSTMGGSLSR